MSGRRIAQIVLCLGLFAEILLRQSPAKVDFVSDVLPTTFDKRWPEYSH